jgi:hypothetical protein
MKAENRLFGNSKEEIFPNEREKERGDEVSLTFDCEKKTFLVSSIFTLKTQKSTQIKFKFKQKRQKVSCFEISFS